MAPEIKGKADSSINRKRIESSSKQPLDSKHKLVSPVTKSELKAKGSTSSSSKTTTSTATKTTTTKKTVRAREKKVYTLAGQRYDVPEEREPLRIFYESLSKQIPSSEMAEFWLMEHGLLTPERAKKAYERKQRRQKELRVGTPIKSPKPPVKSESSQKQQKPASKNGDAKSKRRIIKDSDSEEDFILSAKRRKG